MYKNYFLPASLLGGTIIGAGIFSLPFIFQSAGLGLGFFYLTIASLIYIFVYIMYADIILRTPGEHRFVGYTKMYLGQNLAGFAVLMTIVEMILVLTIYLVLSQSFGNLIMASWPGLTGLASGVDILLIFWLLGSVSIFLGLRRMAWLEFFITGGMAVIILLIFTLGLPRLGALASVPILDPKNFLLPLGPILFALSGRVAIPALVRLLDRRDSEARRVIKKAIVLGTIFPAVVYALFVISILSLSPAVTEDAVSGLISYVPSGILAAVGFFGILSLLSSYMTVGFDVYKSLALDLRLPFWLQFALVVVVPPALYFAGLTGFIVLVSFVGGIFLALEGIFIILMWLKAVQKTLSLPVILLMLPFAAALIYEIIKNAIPIY